MQANMTVMMIKAYSQPLPKGEERGGIAQKKLRTLRLKHPQVGMKTSGGQRKMILEDLRESPGCFSANLLDHQPLTPGPFTANLLKYVTG